MTSAKPERFYLRLRRTEAEIRVHRPADRAAGAWTSNRALRHWCGVGTLDEAQAWAIGTGNIVEARRQQMQVAPDFTMSPDGSFKKGWL